MRLVSYILPADELSIKINNNDKQNDARLGWIMDKKIYDLELSLKWAAQEHNLQLPKEIPSDMKKLLEDGPQKLQLLAQVYALAKQEDGSAFEIEGEPIAVDMNEIILRSPLPYPKSIRDFYAFEQHVKTARARRGLQMIPEWYEFPAFYFSNHLGVIGPEELLPCPTETQELDFELEIACVIGKSGRNIAIDEAHRYMAGLMIMNDWSARDLQRKEMKVGLGPAKGKDFATSLGPYLVTLDELEERRSGEHWNLKMEARVNGKKISQGNLQDLHFSFSQMIAHASKSCCLYPGEIIGSGTVGTGCILELGTDVQPWLVPGDIVELEVEYLGTLRNEIGVKQCEDNQTSKNAALKT